MVAIIDYGMGNLRNVQKALERVGCVAIITSNPSQVKRAKGIVLPGVGAFARAMLNLNSSGLVDVIVDMIKVGKPFLGICLGMQLLLTESEEGGPCAGLDLIKGKVVRFSNTRARHVKVPHMGWNQIKLLKPAPLFKGVPDESRVYFVHSYYALPEDDAVIAAETEHGIRFASVIWKDNIYATQFHPCKSGTIGLKVLENFGELLC